MPTNWVLEKFCLVKEDGGNILTEDSTNTLALQEFLSTEWTEQTETGSG